MPGLGREHRAHAIESQGSNEVTPDIMIKSAARVLFAQRFLRAVTSAGTDAASLATVATGPTQAARDPRGDFSLVMKKAAEISQAKVQAPAPGVVGALTGVEAAYVRRSVSVQPKHSNCGRLHAMLYY